jgi:hypothetical protein
VEDLKNTDFVGFVDETGIKGYVVYVGNGNYLSLSIQGNSNVCNKYYSFDCISLSKSVSTANPTELYRFTTAQELHKWLGEDEG